MQLQQRVDTDVCQWQLYSQLEQTVLQKTSDDFSCVSALQWLKFLFALQWFLDMLLPIFPYLQQLCFCLSQVTASDDEDDLRRGTDVKSGISVQQPFNSSSPPYQTSSPGISGPQPYQTSTAGVQSLGTRTAGPQSADFGYHDVRKSDASDSRQFDHTTIDREVIIVHSLLTVFSFLCVCLFIFFYTVRQKLHPCLHCNNLIKLRSSMSISCKQLPEWIRNKTV